MMKPKLIDAPETTQETDTLALVLAQLTKLKPHELLETEKRIKLLKTTLGIKATDQDRTQTDWLLEGLFYELSSRGLGETIPHPSRLTSINTYKHYQKASAIVRKHFEESIPNLSQVEKIALGRLIARAYITRISTRMKSTAIPLLFSCIESATDAMDDAYPGYVSCGLLGVVLKNREQNYLSS